MDKRHVDITIAVLSPGLRDQWERVRSASVSGTLFHDLRYFDYHTPGRFNFVHLLATREEEAIAILPGAEMRRNDSTWWVSCPGASFGGPATAIALGLEDCLALTKALQRFSQTRSWAGLEFILPPSFYQIPPSEDFSFALHSSGFKLEKRSLCSVIRVGSGPDQYKNLFRSKRPTVVRSSLARGMVAVEGGSELLDEFCVVFKQTYDRLGVAPTHTLTEIRDLMSRFPDRIRLHVVAFEGRPIAGLLVFRLTSEVAYAYYICGTANRLDAGGLVLAFARLLDRLSEQGVKWLDLGPSAQSWMEPHYGVLLFKRMLGSWTFCRDRWRWMTAA